MWSCHLCVVLHWPFVCRPVSRCLPHCGGQQSGLLVVVGSCDVFITTTTIIGTRWTGSVCHWAVEYSVWPLREGLCFCCNNGSVWPSSWPSSCFPSHSVTFWPITVAVHNLFRYLYVICPWWCTQNSRLHFYEILLTLCKNWNSTQNLSWSLLWLEVGCR